MAEKVQEAMDRMVAPLQDLQERGVFSKQEIRAIVTRRRESEYLLMRPQHRKADYLAYIKAEQQLESLRKLRMKRITRQLREEKKRRRQLQQDDDIDDEHDELDRESNRLGDGHILAHIFLLWTRTLRKYKSDLALYLQCAEYCKQTRSWGRLSRLYAQAVQLFPRNADVWIEAASHEYFQKNSIATARILLQRGLRVNPKSIALWLQSFCLELHFVQKMKARKNVLLGIAQNTTATANDKKAGDNQDSDDDENEEKMDDNDTGVNNRDKGSEEEKADSLQTTLKLVKLVFDHAIQSCCCNESLKKNEFGEKLTSSSTSAADPAAIASLCLKFLEQCRLFPGTDFLEDYILKRMTTTTISRDSGENFSNSNKDDTSGDETTKVLEVWMARAIYAREKRKSSTGSSSSTKRGFLAKKDNDDMNNENVSDSLNAAEKDDRMEQEEETSSIDIAVDEVDPVLHIIRQAAQAIPSKEMYTQAIHFLQSYFLEEDDDGDVDKQVSLEEDETDDDYDIDDDNDTPQLSRRQLQCRKLLTTLFKEAAAERFFSSCELALEYVDHVLLGPEFISDKNDDKDKEEFLAHVDAQEILESFVNNSVSFKNISSDFCSDCTSTTPTTSMPKKELTISGAVWIRLAGLVDTVEEGYYSAIAVLDRGLKVTPIDSNPDYMHLLLQYLGGKLEQKLPLQDILSILERLILLFPGFVDLKDIEYCHFNVKSVTHACVRCLEYGMSDLGLDGARKVFNTVLFKSRFAELVRPDQWLLEFLDESINAEKRCLLLGLNEKRSKANLKRLYDTAVQVFQGTRSGDDFKRKRDADFRFKSENNVVRPLVSSWKSVTVPTIDVSTDFSAATASAFFEVFRVLRLRNASNKKTGASSMLSWKHLDKLYNGLGAKDQSSWCVENNPSETEIIPSSFLQPTATKERAYCSFLVQHSTKCFEETLKKLPVSELDFLECYYEPALWVFVGRNPSGLEVGGLQGRKEHTDAVGNKSGTWHFQIAGVKEWSIRPSQDLLKHFRLYATRFQFSSWTDETRLNISCQKGDILVIDTKLWFHQTVIPPQTTPSVSYARDFGFSPDIEKKIPCDDNEGMQNIDGLYATDNIEDGTIIFTDKTVPDCELPRSASKYNCERVDLEDGSQAVVSSRIISAGEFFCLKESDSEDEDEGEGEDFEME